VALRLRSDTPYARERRYSVSMIREAKDAECMRCGAEARRDFAARLRITANITSRQRLIFIACLPIRH